MLLSYIRPGTVWQKYKSVQVLPLVVPRTARTVETNETLPLSEGDAAALQNSFNAAMRREFEADGFVVVDAPRADTVVIAPEITDIVTNEGDISGSLALKATMSDGVTGKSVAHVEDRKFAHYLWEMDTRASSATQVRDAFGNWAHVMADSLKERTTALDQKDQADCLKSMVTCY